MLTAAPKSNLTATTPLPQFSVNFAIQYDELELGNELGRGGFGVVYLGTYRYDDVAIKMLKNDSISAESVKELHVESQIMANLNCDNVVRFRGYCTSPAYCIVMEFMENGSLYQYLKDPSKSLDWKLRYRFALDITKGLAFLHKEKILHRDIKSLNVLLDGHLKAKLTDFGLSTIKREVLSNADETSNDNVGTMAWMAPELHQPNAVYTVKSDMYSFGMTLWEIMSRTTPFAGERRDLIPQWVKQGEREGFTADCPAHFAELIEACWDGAQEKRPTADALIAKLKEGVANSTVYNVVVDPSKVKVKKNTTTIAQHASAEKSGHAEVTSGASGPQYANNVNSNNSGPQYASNSNSNNSGPKYASNSNANNSGPQYVSNSNANNSGPKYASNSNANNSGPQYMSNSNANNSGPQYVSNSNANNSGPQYASNLSSSSTQYPSNSNSNKSSPQFTNNFDSEWSALEEQLKNLTVQSKGNNSSSSSTQYPSNNNSRPSPPPYTSNNNTRPSPPPYPSNVQSENLGIEEQFEKIAIGGEELSLYIPARGDYTAECTHPKPMVEHVSEFFDSDNTQVMLLLGGSGSGKTLFGQYLTQQLTAQKGAITPIWISLPGLKNPKTQLMEEGLKANGVPESQIAAYKKKPLVIILDGYDEVKDLGNLYESNRLSEWSAKVIITCRPEFLQGKNLPALFKPKEGRYTECFVAPFSPNEITSYLEKYIAIHKPKWNLQRYQAEMERFPGLKQMIETPFMLHIIAKVLPDIVDQYQGQKDQMTLTRRALYEQFMEQWFKKHIEKWKSQGKIGLLDQGLTLSKTNPDAQRIAVLRLYAENFAKKLYSAKIDAISSKAPYPWVQALFDNSPRSNLIRSACPLKRTGEDSYGFIDKSIIRVLSHTFCDRRDGAS